MNDFEKYCKLLDDTGVEYKTIPTIGEAKNMIILDEEQVAGIFNNYLAISFDKNNNFIGFSIEDNMDIRY